MMAVYPEDVLADLVQDLLAASIYQQYTVCIGHIPRDVPASVSIQRTGGSIQSGYGAAPCIAVTNTSLRITVVAPTYPDCRNAAIYLMDALHHNGAQGIEYIVTGDLLDLGVRQVATIGDGMAACMGVGHWMSFDVRALGVRTTTTG